MDLYIGVHVLRLMQHIVISHRSLASRSAIHVFFMVGIENPSLSNVSQLTALDPDNFLQIFANLLSHIMEWHWGMTTVTPLPYAPY